MKVWNTVEEVLEHGIKAKNKKIREIVSGNSINTFEQSPHNKGWIGNSIEKDYFELPNNNEKRADFDNLNLELKVTPIIKNRVGWSSKERLILNIINYHDEVTRTFNNASFLEKSRRIMVLLYLYESEIKAPNFRIKDAFILDFDELSEKDKLIIEQDWNIIIRTIEEGNAHLLSDSLTTYLGATTKGAKTEANSTSQPNSKEMSHRRAFSYKTKFMTQVVRNKLGKSNNPESLITDSKELLTKSFDEIILSKFTPFIGKTKKELGKKFGIKIPEKDDKASTNLISKKMLDIKGNIDEAEEFFKASIAVKSVVITESKSLDQHFKLNIHVPDDFKPSEFVKEEWEESILRNYLTDNKFLILIYKKKGKELIFKGAKIWFVPLIDIDKKIKNTWLLNQHIFKVGIELTYKKWGDEYRVYNNLIKPTIDSVVHLRPNADRREYFNLNSNSFKLPTSSRWVDRPEGMKNELGTKYMTRQEWWLNMQYMYKVVESFDK